MPLFGKRRQFTDASPYEAPPIEHAAGTAEAAVPTGHAGGRLTADDVRNVKFGKPPWGKRGYDVDVVDAFLDLAEAELDGPPSADGTGLTPEDVDAVAFAAPPLGRRGYNEDQVDEFLDRVAAELRCRAAQQE